MNELIKVQKSKGGKNIVSAKELYSFLSIDDGSHFARWAKTNIEELFEQNVDYQILPLSGGNSNIGRPSSDYALTLIKAIRELSEC